MLILCHQILVIKLLLLDIKLQLMICLHLALVRFSSLGIILLFQTLIIPVEMAFAILKLYRILMEMGFWIPVIHIMI